MKILMIATTPFFADRGCHVRIYEEIKALQNLGHVVLLCTYHHGRDLPDVNTVRSLRIPWYTKLSAGPSNNKYLADVFLTITSIRTYIKFRPNIVHACLHEGALIGIVLKKLFKCPLLFDYQGSLTGEISNHREASIRGSLFIRGMKVVEQYIDQHVDIVMPSASILANELIEMFKVPEKKVRKVTDGVDLTLFRPVARNHGLRATLNIAPEDRVVVFLGLLTPYQGVDMLIDCMPSILAKMPNTHFIIMGYPNEKEYAGMVYSRGLERKVTFTGRIDYKDAAIYLCLGDVAVAPKLSTTEANGKLFNYMACALPVVAFDTAVNREILGDLAYYATFGSAASLSNSIIEALEDPDDATQRGKLLEERVKALFSWESIIRQVEECYHVIGA